MPRRRGRRDDPAGAAVHGRVLEQPARDRRDAARTHDGETWLHTGDLAYMDEDGYVFIVDRKKDLIKTSGFQVWPREIEEVISAHPAVLEVGVAGVPDPVKGEVAKAWVVLKPGEQGHRGRAAGVLPRAARALQGAGAASSSAPSCRRRWSARSCGVRSRPTTAPAPRFAADAIDTASTSRVSPCDQGGPTSMPAAPSASRTARASAAAPGVSPWIRRCVGPHGDELAVGGGHCSRPTMATARQPPRSGLVDHGARRARAA